MPASPDTTPSFSVPLESELLKTRQKASGLTVADLSAASGVSVSAIHIVLNGYRYRDGQPRLAVPPDASLVKLGAALRLNPEALRAVGRERAGDLLEEAYADQGTTTFASDAEAQAHVAGRRSMAAEILAAFPTEALQHEIARREELDKKAQR